MVSMRNAKRSHLCGCSIITPSWILTAAHCVSGRLESQISIQYGTTIISAGGPNIVGVKRFIIYEDYNPPSFHANDIALLELQTPLVYNYLTIAPVTLPVPYFESSQTLAGDTGILIGWGYEAIGGALEKHLQEVNLKIYSDAECYIRHHGVTTVTQICSGVDEDGKGQCSGDSGGHLLYQGSSIQLVIVSWSYKPCAIAPFPGVYTKVSHYIGWIKDKIN